MDDPTKDTIPRSAVEYCLRKETVSTNPEKYKTHEKFIDYMNDPDISEFGHWMHSNGFNCALTTISVDLEKIPSVTPSAQPGCEDAVYRKAVQMLLAYFVPEERYAEAVDGLRRLPPAQPVAKDINVPVKDCISRQAALEAMETWDKFGCDPDGKLVRYDDDKHYIPYVHYEDMVHAIKHMPPAQPGWIPTSERLPDNDRAVLVTLKWAEDDYEVAVGEYWHNSTASHGWGSFEGHVIAWHELPTPYREGEKS